MTQVDLQKEFKHSPYVPYDPNSWHLYMAYLTVPHGMGVQPFEYAGWREESLAWRDSCYIHAGLNPHTTLRITGPDTIKFISAVCVNSFANFPIGKATHAIMCNEDGYDINDFVLLRSGEDELTCYGPKGAPLYYQKEKSGYDIEIEDLTGKVFNFQLGGPKSLEIAEAATCDDLHDIKFVHAKDSHIDGAAVRIMRVGMCGSLAYEVHGKIEDAHAVYAALIAAGEAYDLQKQGTRAYNMAHYENGFPQAFLDFPYAPYGGDFLDYLDHSGPMGVQFRKLYVDVLLSGSMEGDIKLRYRTPVELGWGGAVKFDHDFIGRAALEKEVAHPRRTMVTLDWNIDDVLDVYRSQFEPGEPYQNMDEPEDWTRLLFSTHRAEYLADQVLVGDKIIGISTGRMNSACYRKMISLCSIDIDYSDLGTEVKVLWGNPGTRQKEIRATVARYPYMDTPRNEHIDVSTIPHPQDVQ